MSVSVLVWKAFSREAIGIDADSQQALNWYRAAEGGSIKAAVALYKSNHATDVIEPVDKSASKEAVQNIQNTLITYGYLKGGPNVSDDEAVTRFRFAASRKKMGKRMPATANAEPFLLTMTARCADESEMRPAQFN